MLLRNSIFLSLILAYGVIFLGQDRFFENREPTLQTALPAKFQQVTSGYLKQIVSEVLFIKASVFLGGIKPGTPAESYAEPLANNLDVMTSLYPDFIDPYYYTQSFLAPISRDMALKTNGILRTGIITHPKDFILRFFQAFNYYNYLDLPLMAAEAFRNTAVFPDAPPMFEHLAVVFSAEGGDLSAGLAMLKTMLVAERDEIVRERYQREVEIFEKALVVENAILLYSQKYHAPPKKLEELIPEYLDQIPVIRDLFVLIYKPPVLPYERMVLRLKRPD